MATLDLKLFARQGSVTDRQGGDYMLPPLGSIKNSSRPRINAITGDDDDQ